MLCSSDAVTAATLLPSVFLVHLDSLSQVPIKGAT